VISAKSLSKELFNIHRSLNSSNNIKTLNILKRHIKKLQVKYFKFKKVFDWKIPDRWEIKSAYIKKISGKKILDINKNKLHVLQYSESVNKIIGKKQLLKNLYFQKDKPNSIPYVTSYYKKRWGFCLEYNKLKNFKDKYYRVHINSKFKKKPLPYGEVYIKGRSKKEIIFCTYICHPNLGNDNLSGIILNFLLAFYMQKKKTNYSYRFLFISETIGSLAYIKKNLNILKKNLLAGYVLSCVGNGKKINIISKYKENFSYNFLNEIFKIKKIRFNDLKWDKRGSDERQFSSPNVNLPFVCITKKRFTEFKEYHSSKDDLKFLKLTDLLDSFKKMKMLINYIENSEIYISNLKGEPMLSKRKISSSLVSSFQKTNIQDNIINFFDLCDGHNSLDMIQNKLKLKKKDILRIVKILKKQNLIRKI